MKIVLMGNPNVGKSALFSRLTGVNVSISNYPGTTVEMKKGGMQFEGRSSEVIDAPGTYSLKPTSKAEEAASKIVKEADIIVNVVDATNLERNLYLTLEMLEKNKPVIIALNFWDEARHKGITVDEKKLSKMLGVPVVPTVAITGRGIKELVSNMGKAKAHSKKLSEKEKWIEIGKIIKQTEKIKYKKHKLLERLEDATIKPLTGIPIALAVIYLAFSAIIFVGESLITYVFDPLFELYAPIALYIGNLFGEGIIREILIGNLVNGQIEFIESMGLLTTGLYVPIAMVLPFVLGFYFVLGLLEDTGYMPRIATLIDAVMHKIGLHGVAIFPMLLGFGCNVPGAMATRILESKKQRFITATIMAISIPCAAQLAMIVGLVGSYGIQALGIVFGTLATVGITLGFILNKFVKGESMEIFMEVPPYRKPYWPSTLKKFWFRIKGFITEAIPYILFGVLLINILFVLGIIDLIGEMLKPLVVGVLGLPQEAVASLIIGFLRKDVAVGMLIPLGLTLKQLVIASVVLAMYFPCIATFIVMFKELGWKDLAKASVIMIFAAFFVGGILNLIL